jgi:hypothetical protein
VIKDPRKYRYNNQKSDAKRRGIPFLLTFAEWWKLWCDSGHWHERSNRRGQYAMSRYFDRGGYAVNNVRIIRVEEHNYLTSLGNTHSPGGKPGRTFSAATRAKMSLSKMGNKNRLGGKRYLQELRT